MVRRGYAEEAKRLMPKDLTREETMKVFQFELKQKIESIQKLNETHTDVIQTEYAI